MGVSKGKKPSCKEKARLKAALTILKLAEQYPDDMLDVLLETSFLPKEISVGASYQRHADVYPPGSITVGIGDDGNAWIRTSADPQDRTMAQQFGKFGNGRESLRVRNGLAFLATAIQLDNLKRPQHS